MAGRKVDTDAFDDVPDLALPAATGPARPPPPPKPRPPVPGKAAPSPVTRPAATAGGGGRELDDDDPFGLTGGGASIELDVAPAPHSMRSGPAASRASGTMAAVVPRAPATSPRPLEVAAAPPAPRLSIPPNPAKPQPVLVGPDEVDPYDARALADYGEPPASLFGTTLYAFRVKTRQADLRRALSTRRLEAERAQAKLEEALAGFGERARAILAGKPGHHRILEDVIAAEQLVLERDGKLAGEMSAHRARMAVIDARLVELEAALAIAQEEERVALEAVTHAEAARARAEAKVRRREIEARNEAATRDPRSR
jgi:hypothetical protein